MRRYEVAVVLGALTSAFVIAAAATSARAVEHLGSVSEAGVAPGATCTSAERARRQAAVAAYRKAMPVQRAAYFRRHKNPRQRATFVQGQQRRLEKLKQAAACRVVRPSTTGETTTQPVSTVPGTTTAPTSTTPTSTAAPPTTTTTTGLTKALQALELAKGYLGTPFVWGGSTPQTGFDDAGLVQWAYANVGVSLPRVAADQFLVGVPVARDALRAGDLVFFQDSTGYVFHVGMDSGGDQFIHAAHTGDVIKFSSLSEPYYAQKFAGGRRVAGD
jgi:cell wall-associated NlpC family hydrolase